MKKSITQQEIMLMTNTSFSKREWCEKENSGNNKKLSRVELLEDACWNGVINEMFPDIVEKSAMGKSLLLAQVEQGITSLQLELCEEFVSIDQYYSINPYAFLQAIFPN